MYEIALVVVDAPIVLESDSPDGTTEVTQRAWWEKPDKGLQESFNFIKSVMLTQVDLFII